MPTTARHGRALTVRKGPASGKLLVLICGPDHGRLYRATPEKSTFAAAMTCRRWNHARRDRQRRQELRDAGLGGDTGLPVQPRFCEWEARQEGV